MLIQIGVIMVCMGLILYHLQRIFDRLGKRPNNHCSRCHAREENEDTQQDSTVDDKKPASTAYRTAPDRVIEQPQPTKDPYPLMEKFLQEALETQAQQLTFRVKRVSRGDTSTARCGGCGADLKNFRNEPCFSLTGGPKTLKTGYHGVFCYTCGTCIIPGPNNPKNKNVHDLIRDEAIRQQIIPPSEE